MKEETKTISAVRLPHDEDEIITNWQEILEKAVEQENAQDYWEDVAMELDVEGIVDVTGMAPNQMRPELLRLLLLEQRNDLQQHRHASSPSIPCDGPASGASLFFYLAPRYACKAVLGCGTHLISGTSPLGRALTMTQAVSFALELDSLSM